MTSQQARDITFKAIKRREFEEFREVCKVIKKRAQGGYRSVGVRLKKGRKTEDQLRDAGFQVVYPELTYEQIMDLNGDKVIEISW